MPRPHPNGEVEGAREPGVQVPEHRVAEEGRPVVRVHEPVTRSGPQRISNGITGTGVLPIVRDMVKPTLPRSLATVRPRRLTSQRVPWAVDHGTRSPDRSP
jgi:hypothetical protein